MRFRQFQLLHWLLRHVHQRRRPPRLQRPEIVLEQFISARARLGPALVPLLEAFSAPPRESGGVCEQRDERAETGRQEGERGEERGGEGAVEARVEEREPEQTHGLLQTVDEAEERHLEVLEQAGDGFRVDVDVGGETRRGERGDGAAATQRVVGEDERPEVHVDAAWERRERTTGERTREAGRGGTAARKGRSSEPASPGGSRALPASTEWDVCCSRASWMERGSEMASLERDPADCHPESDRPSSKRRGIAYPVFADIGDALLLTETIGARDSRSTRIVVLGSGNEINQKCTPPVDNLVAQMVTLADNRIDTLTNENLESNRTATPTMRRSPMR